MQDEISETFKKWNNLKIRIHKFDKFFNPKVGEIWWVSLGQNIGVEINGKNNRFERPALIIKVFNHHAILVAPITGMTKEGEFFIHFINNKNIQNSVNISQLRVVSIKRFLRKAGEMNYQDLDKVRTTIISFIK